MTLIIQTIIYKNSASSIQMSEFTRISKLSDKTPINVICIFMSLSKLTVLLEYITNS